MGDLPPRGSPRALPMFDTQGEGLAAPAAVAWPAEPVALCSPEVRVGRRLGLGSVWSAILEGQIIASVDAPIDPIDLLHPGLHELTRSDPAAEPRHPPQVILCDGSAPGSPARRPDLEAAIRERLGIAVQAWSQGGGSESASDALRTGLSLIRDGRSRVLLAACEMDRGAAIALVPMAFAVQHRLPVYAALDASPAGPATLRIGCAEAQRRAAQGPDSGGPPEDGAWRWTPESVVYLTQTFTSLLPLVVGAAALAEAIVPPSPGGGARAPIPWLRADPALPLRADLLLDSGRGYDTVPLREVTEAGAARPSSCTCWPAEPFLIAAPSRSELLAKLAALRHEVESHQGALGITELARSWRSQSGAVRTGFVAADRKGIETGLRTAARALEGAHGSGRAQRLGVHLGPPPDGPDGEADARGIAFMAPGIGAAYPHLLAGQAVHFPAVRRTLEGFAAHWTWSHGASLWHCVYPNTAAHAAAWDDVDWTGVVGAMAILALARLMRQARVEADMLLGFSNGEMGALLVADAIRPPPDTALERLIWETAASGRSGDARRADVAGRTVAVHLTAEGRAPLQRLLEAHRERVFLTIDASPRHVVLFGRTPEIGTVTDALEQAGNLCFRLPFDRPFHTPLYRDELGAVDAVLAQVITAAPQTPVWSCARNRPYASDPGSYRDAIAEALTTPVRFREAVETLHRRGIGTFVDIGARGQLAGYAKDTLRDRRAALVSLDRPGVDGARQVLDAVAALFAAGVAVDPEALAPQRAPRVDPDAPAPSEPEPAAPASPSPAQAPARPDPRAPAPGHDETPAAPAALTDAERHRMLRDHLALTRAFIDTQERLLLQLAGTLRSGRTAAANGSAAARLLEPTEPRAGEAAGFLLQLRPSQDLHLDHHRLGRVSARECPHPERPLAILAMVIGLEVMAQAAAEVVGAGRAPAADLIGAERLLGSQWISAATDEALLRIAVEPPRPAAHGGTGVRVRLHPLSSSETGVQGAAASARLLFGPETELAPLELAGEPISTAWNAREFNRLALFHGPSFLCLDAIERLTDEGLEVGIRMPPHAGLFAASPAMATRTPAAALDALPQAVAFWLLSQGRRWFTAFPVAVERYRQAAPFPGPGALASCRIRVRQVEDGFTADGSFADADGRVFARIDGMRLALYQLFQPLLSRLYWPETRPLLSVACAAPRESALARACPPALRRDLELAGGIFARALAAVVLNADEQRRWFRTLPHGGRAGVETLLQYLLAKEAAIVWARETLGSSLDPLDLHVEWEPAGLAANRAAVRPRAELDRTGQACFPSIELHEHDGRLAASITCASLDDHPRAQAPKARPDSENARWAKN